MRACRAELATSKASYERLGHAGAKLKSTLTTTRESLTKEKEAAKTAQSEVAHRHADLRKAPLACLVS